jgi:hypothetical protein
LWQPEAIYDSLSPVDQGLTGVMHCHQEGPIESLIFVSPLFVPTMGPEVKEEGGSLVAESRWYRKPSQTFILWGKKREIVYSLNVPNYWDLVQKPGVGYRISYGRSEKTGAWASANAGYKPMNSLLLKYDKKLASAEEGDDKGFAPVYPVVGYHSLWGLDVGYKFPSTAFSASYLEDFPVDPKRDGEDSFIVQKASPSRIMAFEAKQALPVADLSEPITLTAGYLHIDGGGLEDFDSQGNSQGAIFTQRFNFTDAVRAEIEMTSRVFKKALVSKFTYLREFAQRGMIASAEFHYFVKPQFVVDLGADVLGVDDSSDGNTDDRFLNQFRANDRVFGGVTYVF